MKRLMDLYEDISQVAPDFKDLKFRLRDKVVDEYNIKHYPPGEIVSIKSGQNMFWAKFKFDIPLFDRKTKRTQIGVEILGYFQFVNDDIKVTIGNDKPIWEMVESKNTVGFNDLLEEYKEFCGVDNEKEIAEGYYWTISPSGEHKIFQRINECWQTTDESFSTTEFYDERYKIVKYLGR